MIVADTNVTVQLFVASSLSSSARRLFGLDDAWAVPPIWPHEFLNVMATYGKAGGLPIATCVATWRQALGVFGNRIVPPDPDAALQLAIEHRLSVYDAQFVQLALEQKSTCITEDRRLRKKFPETAFSINDYVQELTG